ncbi:hypothetical protein A1O3_01632 [Capronia epimyces CBS 606.96]|uniref:Uncharacterized protein n=1 Tax=Capronia epimyces CBS 606.96 TaxID=1182542 RepID=W9YUY7_9EURO|nr:uncharacterized protein A1O3_01632 [Capronia epimyces CBS 606.96]EXJ93076.1 hypothetical protein A1O3_01632 [Capronia epimyces CBS 606.96]
MESLERAGVDSIADEDVFLQDDHGLTIAEHAIQCQALFHKYMDMPEIVDSSIIEDQQGRFRAWTWRWDVYGPPNLSLDYRLRFSPTATDIIHALIKLICNTLLSLHGNPGVTRRADDEVDDDDDNNNTSDSEAADDPVEDNISKITEIIGGTVTRLNSVAKAAWKNAKAKRARTIERYRDDEEANKAIDELRLYTKCYIEWRFPEAPEALRSALVEANGMRLRRLCYQRSHRGRLDLSIQRPVTPVVAAVYAKTRTEVPRAISVLVNNKLSFPPIPPTQQCPYCGVIVEFENKNTAGSLLWQ